MSKLGVDICRVLARPKRQGAAPCRVIQRPVVFPQRPEVAESVQLRRKVARFLCGTFKRSPVFPGSYSGVSASSGGQGVVQSPQHQMSLGTPQQQQEMYMTGVHMNGGMGSEYQGGSSVSANVQSQVSNGQ